MTSPKTTNTNIPTNNISNENNKTPPPNSNKIIKPLDTKPIQKKNNMWLSSVIILIIIFLGSGSGYILANQNNLFSSKVESPSQNQTTIANEKAVSNDTEAGIKDEKQFPDTAEGILEANDGSVTTEGTHRLIREGGPDKTAYLTSSVVDLSKFEGKKVMIMGQTYTAQTAGWLLDVGYIKVIK